MGKTCHIHSQEGYEKVKERVSKGAKYLKGRFFDIKYQKAVEVYEAMALAMLAWEIRSGIFGERFDRWVLEEKG